MYNPCTFGYSACSLTALLIAHKMTFVVDLAKLRTLLRVVRPWHVGFALGACLLLGVVLIVAGLLLLPEGKEASGQPVTSPALPQLTTPQEPAITTATPPSGQFSFPPLPTAQSAKPKPPAIPHLSLMEVLGNLTYLPHTKEFACTSGPTEGPETFWTCWSPGDGSAITRIVTVLGNDPGSISSVTATARGLDDQEAAEFFSYVGGLCLPDNDPTNLEAWVDQNISSGGSLFAKSADLTLYGTKQERTLEIVAPGLTL
jgi:hypothetical protein